MTLLRAAVALVLMLLAPLAARAELWAFVDAQGMAHFAAREVDSRYRLVLGNELPSQRTPGKTDLPAGLLLWMEIAPEVKAMQPLLREAGHLHGIDSLLLQALIAVESGFNPAAVSPRGAVGLMQITAAAADRYSSAEERRLPAAQRLLDARTNIHTGARMLADLVRRLGRVDLALAAWNAGEGAVRRHKGLPPYDETRAHVQQVLELYWALLQNSLGVKARGMSLQ